ncbi:MULTISPECIES: hypothetical protein [unclassified Sporosarcina]|uniref:hypothetical protein n=1 Tax=unclassified Sporosarcina TaxID=2647733 RepID=UPI00203B3AE7|nr:MULTISPECIES: hypothetical protein [unclassified Sporosarcina]GKV66586.1 hypothetical protein NCCP2331_27390 [Sporosarcina sp. NCCP-2331]GLB56863.1 hypothetical protein NCCP2378_26500 [Sporosarcina sp. NCCP-2378]
MEKKLDLILQKLEAVDRMGQDIQLVRSELVEVKTQLGGVETQLGEVTSQLDENTLIIKAIRSRQTETDAKLEGLTLDVHKMHGDVTAVKEKLSDIQGEVEFTYQKTAKNEMELFKLKRDYN